MPIPKLMPDDTKARSIAAKKVYDRLGWYGYQQNDGLEARDIAVVAIDAYKATLLETGTGKWEPIETALRGVVTAWNSLPGNKNYSPKVIESWLIHNMAPAIYMAREALKALTEETK